MVARTRALFKRARPWVDHVGANLFAERPSLTTADKAIVLTRALAWRGATLPPRSIHLLLRLTLGPRSRPRPSSE